VTLWFPGNLIDGSADRMNPLVLKPTMSTKCWHLIAEGAERAEPQNESRRLSLRQTEKQPFRVPSFRDIGQTDVDALATFRLMKMYGDQDL
jgi:hypothetical protein